MPKPSSLPRWGDNLADPGDIVEPSSGKKDIGWQDAEKPPHSYFNWLFNLIYQWCSYLNGLTGEALTWTAAHIFQSTVSVTNSTNADTVTIAATSANANYAIRATGNATNGGLVATSSKTGGAIVGSNSGTGANAAGVTGGGVKLGVDGVALGGGGSGSAAVRGMALDADARGGLFTNNNASGEALEATASGASGKAAHFVASDATGTALHCEATGGGLAADFEGEVAVENSFITLINSGIRNGSPVERWVHVPLSSLQVVRTGAMGNSRFFDDTGGASSVPAAWYGQSGATTDLVGGDIKIPAGATISEIGFWLDNQDGASRTFSWRLHKVTFGETTFSAESINPAGEAAFDTISVLDSAAAWESVALSDVAPLNNDPTNFGGHYALQLKLPSLTTDDKFALRGIRIKYEYTNVKELI